ncbi:MAG: O-acetyl-ADP-ribose deacetylase [Flavobacteriales bacterium]|nr:O-acetyl-ADP-ribose deacetylase [Flavobacteriales bacterium]
MKILLTQGDITKVKVDAIVNAANTSLLGGGGVDGAIHRNGGNEILDDCIKIRQKQGGCKIGEAVITSAGKLPAKHVIHTVGPVYNNGGVAIEELLASCYRNSIQLLLDHGLKTIAFPNISTGIYKFPKKRAAKIAIQTVQEFQSSDVLKEVSFVCFDDENHQLYAELLN